LNDKMAHLRYKPGIRYRLSLQATSSIWGLGMYGTVHVYCILSEITHDICIWKRTRCSSGFSTIEVN